jgi:hypothetical protein
VERRTRIKITVRENGNSLEWKTNSRLMLAMQEAEELVEQAGGPSRVCCELTTPLGARYRFTGPNTGCWMRVSDEVE